MNDTEKYEYWLAYAQEDLLAAEAMMDAKRWMYVALVLKCVARIASLEAHDK